VVISSGFAEVGVAGTEMQRALLVHAHRGGMRVIGPNSQGADPTRRSEDRLLHEQAVDEVNPQFFDHTIRCARVAGR
jgi:hypothetical protein